MKTTSKFFGIILFLFGMLCFSGCSSSDDDGDSYVEDAWGDPGTSASNFNPSYSDYIGTSDFKTDYAHLLDLAVAVQYYKDNMFLAYLGDDSTPFAGDPVPEAIDALVSLEGEINEMYDEYKPSLDRLMQSGILDTESPTRGYLGAAWASFKFFVTCKNTGENSRKTMLGVLAQNPEDSKEIFDNLPTNWKQGETDYAKWIQNMSEGKYDNIASAMYSEVYNTSGALWMDNRGGKLWEYANDHKVRPKDNLNNAAPELWAAGAGFATSYLTTAKTFPGVITNIKDAALGSKVAGEALVIPIGVSVGAVATNMTTKMLSKTTNKTEAEKNALKKDLEKASEQYINKLKNESNPKTTVDVKDSDSSSPATTVIVTDKDGNMTFGIGGTKVPVNLDGQQNGTVTAVDETGDKFTKTVPLTPGQNNQVEGSSDEKEKIVDEEPYFEVDNNTLVFSSEPKGAQTVTVKTNLKLRVKKDPKYGWLTVKRNKNIITVSATKNTGDERKASFKIEFSKNGETVYDAITVKVEQKAFQDIVSDDLGFIDFRKFRITAGKFGTPYSGINPMSYSYVENGIEKYMVFSNSELSIQKVNSGTYWVKGSRSVPEYYQGNPAPAGGQINGNEPYGLYFDMSFNITACDPTDYVKNNNCRIEDFVISGYAKRTAGVSDCDDYIEFHYEFGHMDVFTGFVPSEGAEFNFVNTSFNEGEEAVWGKFWIDNQWYTSTYLGDGKHEYTHHSQTYEKRETNMYNMSCTLTARWD